MPDEQNQYDAKAKAEAEPKPLDEELDPVSKNLQDDARRQTLVRMGAITPQELGDHKSLHDPQAIASRESLEQTRYRSQAKIDGNVNSGANASGIGLSNQAILELDNRVTALEVWRKGIEAELNPPPSEPAKTPATIDGATSQIGVKPQLGDQDKS